MSWEIRSMDNGNDVITKREIENAQTEWGKAICEIGRKYTDGLDYRIVAENMIDSLYAFEIGPVLFKPTNASNRQFRTSRKSALSYFISGDNDYPEDKGFGLQPWIKVRFENVATFIHGNYAVAMGNYFFTNENGRETKVEFTFGYLKDKDGNLRINLHHSSLPYLPAPDPR
ncbi:MAG: hypothetical protein GXP49_02080 [Deltaproteobacteria bacterium]|nr:hypothetical protein [Deltaproteobacteria bacterium]